MFVVLLNCSFFFFFNDTATTEIYTLSLHDALPISRDRETERGEPAERRPERSGDLAVDLLVVADRRKAHRGRGDVRRSEEHTSELQSPCNLVCRLLLEKKNIAHLMALLWS